MFFRRPIQPRRSTSVDPLRDLVREHLPHADPDTQHIVVAVAGLLAAVAYADREYGAAEQAYARAALSRMDGLTSAGVDAISDLLREHGAKIASVNPQAYTRELRDRTDPELRREVLDLLLDLAAADGELPLAETDMLRRTAAALGLSPDDYLASQARHRDKLKVLK
jgi:uncharacterized tellurite resistance protein B-like protein